MDNRSGSFDPSATLRTIDQAVAEAKLTASSGAMIRRWLTEPRYADYTGQIADHVAAEKWRELDDAFWTVIPFGTAGRRGKMYPIGSNAINDRTIGESAQGLADYVRSLRPLAPGESPGGCAIAYDVRHNSRHFAQLCAEVMAAAGFKVYFLDGHRSTPELSFAVRFTKSTCGIMVTASHNPPSDNAVKVYWDSGVQVLPPHDHGIIERVMTVNAVYRRPFREAVAAGQIVYCQDQIDPKYIAAVTANALSGPRALKIVYSPLHGVGATSVLPVLNADGFNDVELFGPHAEPSGDFPNVPGHISNPEVLAVFADINKRAQEVGADLVMASDPDADRIGAAAPLTVTGDRTLKIFNGNQIGALLAEHILSSKARSNSLTPDGFVCKTLVTTEMVRRIADRFGVKTYGNLLVGCKWIGKQIDESGPDRFLFGCEEAHGYLIGTHVRDKDAAVAAMVLAELAAACKAEGLTLHQKLDAMYRQYGYHAETQLSMTMPGAAGMQNMLAIMARLRSSPPTSVGGHAVARRRDYQQLTQYDSGNAPHPLDGPKGDLLIFDLDCEGTYFAVRPSGTEPKIKFYFFSYESPQRIASLDDTKSACSDRLARMQSDVAAFVNASA